MLLPHRHWWKWMRRMRPEPPVPGTETAADSLQDTGWERRPDNLAGSRDHRDTGPAVAAVPWSAAGGQHCWDWSSAPPEQNSDCWDPREAGRPRRSEADSDAPNCCRHSAQIRSESSDQRRPSLPADAACRLALCIG